LRRYLYDGDYLEIPTNSKKFEDLLKNNDKCILHYFCNREFFKLEIGIGEKFIKLKDDFYLN
jgi:hypothetical protein